MTNNVKTIKEYLENRENKDIEQKNRSIVLPVSLIVIAIAVIIAGAVPGWLNTYLSLTLITTGLLILIVGIVKLCHYKGNNKYCYFHLPSHDLMRKDKIFVSEETAQDIRSARKANDFSCLKHQKPAFQSAYCLEIIGSKEDKFFLAQLLHFENYIFVPETEIMLIEGENADFLTDFSTRRL